MSYIPKGCDQQGRHPEAAAAATEVGADDDAPEYDMLTVVLKDVAIAVTLLVLIHALLFWVIYG